MGFEIFIGRRYLRAKQKQAFISLITILSVAGVAVGVMALIVVIAVMTGFEADLKSRILGGQPQVMIMRHGGAFTDYRQVLQEVEKTPGVEAATPFIYAQIMLRSKYGASGAVLRGIDPDSAGRVMKTLQHLNLPSTDGDNSSPGSSPDIPGIVLGRELAKNLGVIEGDVIYLISPRGMISPIGHVPSMKQFRVSGFFESGMYEYDQTFAYINIKDAQKIMRLGDAVTGLDVRVTDIYHARRVAQSITEKLGFPYWARDWMQMNRNLFKALKLERRVMFIILTLIILVAAFNIASSLIMMVMGKTKDIAILKAMGATERSIRKIFVFNGRVIGTFGTLVGVGLGLVICTGLKYYDIHELTGDIYYFTTKLPVKLEFLDVVSIIVAALLICFLATLYPARQAAKLNPVDAIRYG
ncbi:MAG: lipoprotein-releasing ABC transporter permease subunit [Desulfobacterales bacterium]|nr:MAG: lipoprotein-releasing ABC transporter permease subunit [Desulfobacterales bacterium]